MQSIMRISEAGLPAHKKLRMGLNKSTVLEVPRDLRDVMVSDPSVVDAVVQTSNRVFLLGKKSGVGQRLLLRRQRRAVPDARDLRRARRLRARGAAEPSDAGLQHQDRDDQRDGDADRQSVRSPIDAARAVQIATQFAAVEITQASAVADTGNTDIKATGGDAKTKVINLLTIDAEEQVMLQVVVAEVQRSLMKQFGINLGAPINVGQFRTKLLTENALPLTAAAGLGNAAGARACSTDRRRAAWRGGTLCSWNNGPVGRRLRQLRPHRRLRHAATRRINHAMRALERDGLIRTLAEPNLTAVSGETAKFLAGGEYPIPVVDTSGQLSVTYKEFGVGVAFTPVVLSEGRISLKIETEV